VSQGGTLDRPNFLVVTAYDPVTAVNYEMRCSGGVNALLNDGERKNVVLCAGHSYDGLVVLW
jgi:hypothetical protein